MPEIIYASDNDGYQSGTTNSDWDTTHDDVGSGSPNTNKQYYHWAISGTYYGAPRDFYFTRRVFLDFDLSSLSPPAGGSVSAATLSVYVSNNSFDDTDIIALKSGHDPSNTSEDWYSTWLTGLGGTLSGWSNSDPEVVDYSGQVTTTGTGYGHHSFALNPDARSDLFSLAGTSDLFKVVLMDYPYDYLDSAPSGASELGIYFANYSGDTRTPVLTLTFAAVGYGNDVIGVDSGDISTINGIATADISKVNGI